MASLSQAVTFTPVPSADLDLSNLGRVGIAGDFAGISLYQYEGQNEQSFNTNGSESLMARLPNGLFTNLLTTDASIQTMCAFRDALILGGNFTSLDGQESNGIAQYNLNDNTLTPLAGLSGQVNSLFCDDNAGKVYVGGSFKAADSTNAITWVAGGNWASLPFAGFNGPVTSITKASNGHIIFGGSFTGLGNASTPSEPDEQTINLSTATITADQSTAANGFSDPKNIVCKTGGVDGAGSTWLLADNTPGTWRAKFRFGFQPTKLRLWNTHQDGRGTETWRYTALPINGIMNFTYLDPATKQNRSCTSECPLSNDPATPFQDFHFVNNVGMNEFRLDVSAWYGSGGGLNGIELFQDDIFAYAINDFNEPTCGNAAFVSTATTTGPWAVTPSGQSNSDYLSVNIPSPVTPEAATVTFYPNIQEAGNYTVSLYTPGCLQDETCSSRAQVNVTWSLAADTPANSKVLFQTNNFDKYDVLDTTIVDAVSGSFRPSITIAPLGNQVLANMTMVAQKVGFVLISSTGGLNGLFEYDPSKATVDTADFEKSAFDKLGASFNKRSAVSSLVTAGDITYIGGNFTSERTSNIIAINSKDNNRVALDGGINGEIVSMYMSEGKLFVGGTFNNTQQGSAEGLRNVAVYDTAGNRWDPLGAGVNGPVTNVVPLTLNLSSSTPENVIAVTGMFTELLGFGNNSARTVDGFAVWVQSRGNWLNNLAGPVPFLEGILSTSLLDLPGNASVYAGSVTSQALKAGGIVGGGDSLLSYPIDIEPSTNSSASSSAGKRTIKRATLPGEANNVAGVKTGAFYEDEGVNVTILAGHFLARGTDGSLISNLAFIDGVADDKVTGLPSGIQEDSVFLSVAVHGTTLFAGGRINGTVSGDPVAGLISFNMADKKFNVQPPSLSGENATVSSIVVRPNSGEVWVGGSFGSAGSLDCPSVCMFSTSTSQWSRPGLGLEGSVHSMMWSSPTKLVVAGNMTLNNTATYLAVYDTEKTAWANFPSASSLPGPAHAVTAANRDSSQLWIAGTAGDQSTYLMKYDGDKWSSTPIQFDPNTVISSLQVFSLTSSHDSNDLIDSNQVLMIAGHVSTPEYGPVSSLLFDGKDHRPYALSSKTGHTTGSIARIFVQKQNFFTSPGMLRLFPFVAWHTY